MKLVLYIVFSGIRWMDFRIRFFGVLFVRREFGDLEFFFWLVLEVIFVICVFDYLGVFFLVKVWVRDSRVLRVLIKSWFDVWDVIRGIYLFW